MRPKDRNYARDLIRRFCQPRPTQRVSDWVAENVEFNEPKLTGRFSFVGREYLRDGLDDWNNPHVKDIIDVFGTGAGKTISRMAGAAYRIAHDPSRFLWVMPTTEGPGGARRFSTTRFQEMIRATRCLRSLIPKGADRHSFSGLSMSINGTVIDLGGSNSPGQLAANRCDVVVQDETDKFNEGTEREASASYLADERTKGMSMSKRLKSSSPTLMSGLIWQEYLKSDMQRRFLPCPNCAKFVVLVWSKQFTVFPLLGCEAFIQWDAEAKNKDGSWDLEQVVKSAHMECPHCKGKILDHHKLEMDAKGEWRATNPNGAPGYRGRHLPSMYVNSFECNFGQMAKKFLLNKNSVEGLKGFINSDLAEPYLSQDSASKRVELITAKQKLNPQEWNLIMTVDCQQKPPYFRYLIRAWKHTGDSQGLKYGPADNWEEVHAIQLENQVKDDAVWVDSGFQAKSGEADVYRNCAQHGTLVESQEKYAHLGWLPCKGFSGKKRWRDKDDKTQQHPWFMGEIDPYMGTDKAGQVVMNLFEYSDDYIKDALQNLRGGKTQYQWSVCDEMSCEQYWKEMDAEHKVTVLNKRTGFTKVEWQKRHKDWPNEAFDLEKMQTAAAMFYGLFEVEKR